MDVNYPDTGYRSTVTIRFSDGTSDLRLFQEFGNTDGTSFVTSAEYPALPKHGSGQFTVSSAEPIPADDLAGMVVRKHMWDQDWRPLVPARVSDASRPESTWQAATAIQGQTTYLVVSPTAGQALTHEGLNPVPATEGVSEARQGYYGTPVVVEDRTLIEPAVVQDNLRWWPWSIRPRRRCWPGRAGS